MSKKKPQEKNAAEPKRAVLAAHAKSCKDDATQEKCDDSKTASKTRSTPEPMASKPRGRGKRAGGVSSAGVEIHAEFDGDGKRAGQSATAGATAKSTRPLAATRELATAAGSLHYHVVAERLAVNIAHCLNALLEEPSENIRITPEWICDIHRRIAGDLFPEWAGRFRTGDFQVGTHLPPPGHEVAIHVKISAWIWKSACVICAARKVFLLCWHGRIGAFSGYTPSRILTGGWEEFCLSR